MQRTRLRQFIKRILSRPVSSLANRFSTRPDKSLVHESLTHLFKRIKSEPGKKGELISFSESDCFIIFSDQHKGAKDGSDDFSFAENNYLKALEYYNERNFRFINLGDSEELWENNILSIKKHYTRSFEAEARFLARAAYYKVFGNHDLYWDNDPLASVMLESIYQQKVKIYEGIVLQTQVDNHPLQIFLTHGHQGDQQSDGNWFSKWFVSNVWAPLQMYLELNLNTPAYDDQLKTTHNQYMYEWAAANKSTVLITGHTHQPVFLSLTYIERLFSKLLLAEKKGDLKQVEDLKAKIELTHIKERSNVDYSAASPNYFNTGCCCFNDGDITGIEIEGGFISLIKWEYDENNVSRRQVLEKISLAELAKLMI